MFALVLLALAVFSTDKQTTVKLEAELIELNHVYNDEGQLWLYQAIGQYWRHDIAGHDVGFWCRVTTDKVTVRKNGEWWYLHTQDCVVRTRTLRVTHTQYDRETFLRTGLVGNRVLAAVVPYYRKTNSGQWQTLRPIPGLTVEFPDF